MTMRTLRIFNTVCFYAVAASFLFSSVLAFADPHRPLTMISAIANAVVLAVMIWQRHNIGTAGRPLAYDKAGRPISTSRLAELLNEDYVPVAMDRVGDTDVFTAWLGVDRRIAPWGPPLIFETLVLARGHCKIVDHYSTEDQAREGHQRVVIRLKARAN